MRTLDGRIGSMPVSTLTPLAAAAFADPEVKAKAESAQPIGRLGEPHEIAEMTAWLLSDASSFAIGSAFYVDGGVTRGLIVRPGQRLIAIN
ncbi:SDR family oxidoreductase [Pseudarthrobacter sp. IC2-21]|uniref:SDR family oxidoreductase n=1 Tax=Pseudarthrobacter sp. IC2-21 TaxID=3092262 RepID=UPI002A6A75BE|nr:SDR family oxidoreductase [Pseudarthrobacter sp. IC2-21]